MNRIIKTLGLLALLSFWSITNANAQHNSQDKYQNQSFRTTARVIDVEPIIRNVQVSTPNRECWNEEVTHASYSNNNNGVGKILLGGLIGGVIGNQFGRGRGKKAATIAGTVIGAAVGNNSAKNDHHATTRQDHVEVTQRCRVSNTTHNEQRIEGYWVSYRFKGETFRTRMHEQPGNNIDVRVSVSPIY